LLKCADVLGTTCILRERHSFAPLLRVILIPLVCWKALFSLGNESALRSKLARYLDFHISNVLITALMRLAAPIMGFSVLWPFHQLLYRSETTVAFSILYHWQPLMQPQPLGLARYSPYSQDELRVHLIHHHNEDLPASSSLFWVFSQTTQAWTAYIEERRINLQWWRCFRCLQRIMNATNDYECPYCQRKCEYWRQNSRNPVWTADVEPVTESSRMHSVVPPRRSRTNLLRIDIILRHLLIRRQRHGQRLQLPNQL
jgi:hypothetical protein